MKINKFLSGVYSKAKGYAERHSMVKVLSTLGAEDTPVGTIISYMGKNPPAHYLACDGAVYNIADYEDLSTFILNEYGSVDYFGGDGTTTFAVPDLRGEFLRGTGTNSHLNQGSGAGVGEHQDGTLQLGILKFRDNKIYVSGYNQDLDSDNNTVDISVTGGSVGRSTFTHSDATTKYNQNMFVARPTNTSVLYCIKYEQIVHVTVSGSKVYATSEHVVGEWIDGSTLYGITIQFPSTLSIKANTWNNVYDVSYLGIKCLIDSTGYTGNFTQVIKPDFVMISGTMLRIFGHAAAANGIEAITLEYTKK